MARIFGIDLGTTNSLIAVMEDGHPRVIADSASGNPLLPFFRMQPSMARRIRRSK